MLRKNNQECCNALGSVLQGQLMEDQEQNKKGRGGGGGAVSCIQAGFTVNSDKNDFSRGGGKNYFQSLSLSEQDGIRFKCTCTLTKAPNSTQKNTHRKEHSECWQNVITAQIKHSEHRDHGHECI